MKNLSVSIWLTALLFGLGAEHAAASGADEMKESANMPGYQPKDGIVPDAKTAIAIAVAVWNPVYGEKEIASEKPYSAVLQNGRWTVTSSVRKGWVGGAATAVISKIDGRVVKIYHTK
jgi:hypothetical protein